MMEPLQAVVTAAHVTKHATSSGGIPGWVTGVGVVLGGAAGFALGQIRDRARIAPRSPARESNQTEEEIQKLRAEAVRLQGELSRARGATRAPTKIETAEDERWIELVERCVDLFNELDGLAGAMTGSDRELVDHIGVRLQNILEQSGVEVIDRDVEFDRARHRPVPAVAAPPGSPIAETVSPGFAVGRRVLRRASVRVES